MVRAARKQQDRERWGQDIMTTQDCATGQDKTCQQDKLNKTCNRIQDKIEIPTKTGRKQTWTGQIYQQYSGIPNLRITPYNGLMTHY
ncbi:hypothetical protein BY996DRAFT_6514013 [Phakopsora pachyrhizi]|nr:hypothetical protein BY996DRAFT_6514013 [Phakopsora pachyrhizi]